MCILYKTRATPSHFPPSSAGPPRAGNPTGATEQQWQTFTDACVRSTRGARGQVVVAPRGPSAHPHSRHIDGEKSQNNRPRPPNGKTPRLVLASPNGIQICPSSRMPRRPVLSARVAGTAGQAPGPEATHRPILHRELLQQPRASAPPSEPP